MNDYLLASINGLAGNRIADALMTAAASWFIFVVFAVGIVVSAMHLRSRDWKPVVLFGAVLAAAFGLNLLAAVLHPELRPFQTHALRVVAPHAPGQSFPSDHATAAFAVGMGIFTFFSRRLGSILIVLAAVIGFARVYAGIHYPGDIAGGALVAAVATALVTATAGIARNRRLTALPAP